jgi:hypothetical protein
MSADDTSRRLAALIVEALELGSGKHERDVADDLFETFGIHLNDLQEGIAGRRRRKERLRAAAAATLAAAAPSPEALMTGFVRCGGRFVAMVGEIFTLLAEHAATTTGTTERFRLRSADLDLEITISAAFVERVRLLSRVIRQVPVGRIDHRAVQRFLGWDGGELYGRWPLEGGDLRLLDAVLRTGRHGLARPAVEQLVAAVEALLDAHMANLDAAVDVDTLFFNIEKHAVPSAVDELERFHAEGLLGATPVEYLIDGVDGPTFLGMDHTGASVARPARDGWDGSAMSHLAAFLTMWRAGMRPARDPSAAQVSPEVLHRACEEAAAWLRDGVLVPDRSVERQDVVESFEELLNLPLWRGRQLLYEVWVLVVTLRACGDAGWDAELRLLKSVTGGDWELTVAPSPDPVARLRHRSNRTLALDVWREPRRRTATGEVTPDITIATIDQDPRDLVVIEAKDRYDMRIGRGSDKRGALATATRYRRALRPNATWVCNHCDFRERDTGPEINHGDAWSNVHLAAEFRPGSIPATFARSLEAALAPPGGVRAIDRLVLVIDMTGSMSPLLPDVWSQLRGLTLRRDTELRAVIYADHGAGEPFLTRDIGPCDTVDELVRRLKAQPTAHGQDPEEALEDAMQRCRKLADELGPLTALVVTDAPPHPVENCPLGIDFNAEVQALLDAGGRLLVCTDWRIRTDPTWRPFTEHPGFAEAPLAELVATLGTMKTASGRPPTFGIAPLRS